MTGTTRAVSLTRSAIRYAAAAAILAAIVIAFVRQHRAQPDITSINGVYANPCCESISIENGVVAYGQQRAKIQLVNKLVLQGWLSQPIGPFYFVDGDKKQPSVLVFNGTGDFSVDDYAGNERTFRRLKRDT